jgi:hypothetical protein
LGFSIVHILSYGTICDVSSLLRISHAASLIPFHLQALVDSPSLNSHAVIASEIPQPIDLAISSLPSIVALPSIPVDDEFQYDVGGIPSPHKLDASAARKYSRLCFQKRLFDTALDRLEAEDKAQIVDPFPFDRRTLASDTATFCDLRIVNSRLLPGILAITPTPKKGGVIKKDKRLASYGGGIMTEFEYGQFTDSFGVYTGVGCNSLNALIRDNSRWKKVKFIVTSFNTSTLSSVLKTSLLS